MSPIRRRLKILALTVSLLCSPWFTRAQESAEVNVDNTTFSGGLIDARAGLAFSSESVSDRKGGSSSIGILRIWDLSTGLPVEDVLFPARIFDLKIDRETSRLAILGGPGNRDETEPFVAVYDYVTRRSVFVTPPGLVPSRDAAMAFGSGNSLLLGPGPDADEYQRNEPAYALTWSDGGDVSSSPIDRSDFLHQFAGRALHLPPHLSPFEVMDADGGLALVATGNGQTAEIWDAENGEKLFAVGHRANQVDGYCLSPDGKSLAAWQSLQGRIGAIYLWNFQSMKQRVITRFPDILDGRRVVSLGLSGDGSHAALVVEEPQEDLDRSPLFSILRLSLSESSASIVDSIHGLDKVLWDGDGQSAITWKGGSAAAYDAGSGQTSFVPGNPGINTLSASPDRRVHWREFRNESSDPGPLDQGVELVDTASGSVLSQLPSQSSHFTQNIHVDYASDGMLVGSECKVSGGGYTHSELNWITYGGDVVRFSISEPEGAMLIWSGLIERAGHRLACSARSNGILETFDLASGAVLSSAQDPQIEGWFQNLTLQATARSGGWAILPRKDGGIRFKQITETGQFELMADLLLSDENRWLLRTREGYYWTSPDGERSAFINHGGTSVPIGFLDIAFHRPHEVARKLGSEAGVVQELEYSWLARLRRHGLNPDSLPELDRIPVVHCDTPPPLVASNSVWMSDFTFEGLTHPEARLHVLVNEVPVYGRAGSPLPNGLERTPLSVAISRGVNELEVFVREPSGLESVHWRGRTWLSSAITDSIVPPRLHILAIGVSDYADDAFDLEFAAKDARDLVETFKNLGQQHGFGEVLSTLVLDGDATRDGIIEGSRALGVSDPDDSVIVFFAGHGVVDEKGDYYFGTHDFNPAAPGGKGLTYQSIQSLFDTVPARKRLMFLDTCQAGELEEVELASVSEKLASADPGLRLIPLSNVTPAPSNPANRLLRDMFSDLRTDTGAHVLCAAQGAEFALESGEIGNGIFTHFLLKKVLTGEADLDADGQVLVPELIESVATEVSALTEGEQNPVLRESNQSFQFALWPDGRRHQKPRQFIDTYFRLSARGDQIATRERILNLFAPTVLYFGKPLNRDQIDADLRGYFERFYGVSYGISDVTEDRSPDFGEVTFRYTLRFQAYTAVKKPGEDLAQVQERNGELLSRMVITRDGLSWRIKEIGVER